jgi:MAF protein
VSGLKSQRKIARFVVFQHESLLNGNIVHNPLLTGRLLMNESQKRMPLILASTSPFRRSILQKLQLKFNTESPKVDEISLTNETPTALVKRLALAKALAVAANHPAALIIGSDQVAVFNGKILGKPHTHENAIKQLTTFSGNQVMFLTGLSLVNSQTGQHQTIVEPFSVYFRQLTSQQIETYLLAEQPYNCAGSFKSEGFGICLFDKLEGDDPNTLIGLPLIRLVALLSNEGVDVLST